MPIYEFNCPQCEITQELLLSFSQLETEKPPCPVCDTQMQNIISAPAGRVAGGTPKYHPFTKGK